MYGFGARPISDTREPVARPDSEASPVEPVTPTPVTYVELRKSATRWPLKRPQQWYFVQILEGNREPLTRSTEMYTNKAEALDAAVLAHGPQTTVFLQLGARTRESAETATLLRLADPV